MHLASTPPRKLDEYLSVVIKKKRDINTHNKGLVKYIMAYWIIVKNYSIQKSFNCMGNANDVILSWRKTTLKCKCICPESCGGGPSHWWGRQLGELGTAGHLFILLGS